MLDPKDFSGNLNDSSHIDPFVSSFIKKNKPITGQKELILELINQVCVRLDLKDNKNEILKLSFPLSLSKREITLFLLTLQHLKITEIKTILGVSMVFASYLIYRKQLNGTETGLLVEHLVERTPDKRIKITEEGVKTVISIILNLHLREQEIEQEQSRRQELETKSDEYEEFLTSNFQEEIAKSQKTITIDFMELAKFNFKLADSLLDNPDEDISLMQSLYYSHLTKKLNTTDIRIHFIHLPKNEDTVIGEKRVKDLNKMVRVVGQVTRTSEVLPHTSITIFRCPSCMSNITVIQNGDVYREPKTCPSCGRKGKLIEFEKRYDDVQYLLIEELAEQLGQRIQQQTLKVVLHGDLCGVDNQPAFEDSTPLIFNGILRENPTYLKNNNKSTSGKYLLDVVGIEIPENRRRLQISKKREKELKEFSKREDLHEALRLAFLPYAYGRSHEIDALFLGMVSGGNPKITKIRDDAHILFVGDPGVMKSTMLKRGLEILPGSRWISGKGTSSAGLLGTVTKDNSFGGGPSLEKGILPLANQNVAWIDEMDKMDENELNSLNEALANQTITINKWNKHATFRTDCTAIVAANPTTGHFDRSMGIMDQISLPRPLVDRFDMVIPLFDTVSKTDVALSNLLITKFEENGNSDKDTNTEFLREYLYYARSMPSPSYSPSAKEKIKDFFVNLRAASVIYPDLNLSITARELEGLLRLTRAHAKLRLATEVSSDDADFVIDLKKYFFSKIGLNMHGKEAEVLDAERSKRVKQW